MTRTPSALRATQQERSWWQASSAMGLLVALWLCWSVWRAVTGHYALKTNAFDLSVFDYSLWSLKNGALGFVPFYGYSIFSDHFMPVLYLLVPAHALFPSPVLLLVLQAISTALAAVLYWRAVHSEFRLRPWMCTALVLVFLLARRTHSAMGGYFYPEAFQTPLMFGMVLSWTASPWLMWSCIGALLMTKEDAAIYVAAFAAFAFLTRRGSKSRNVAAFLAAIIWFVVALTVLIPASQRADGGRSSETLQSRYGEGGEAPSASTLAGRLLSLKTGSTLVNLAAAGGFLSGLGPAWVLPAIPGLAANLAANPESSQSGLIQHYAWPILPWVFLSAAAGLARLNTRWPRLAIAWLGVLAIGTVIDNPGLQRTFSSNTSPSAAVVLEQLGQVQGTVILAQPNLIPHLPKSASTFSLGLARQPSSKPDLVLLTTVGNLWPFSADDISRMVETYRRDPDYVEAQSGPLFAFTLTPRSVK